MPEIKKKKFVLKKKSLMPQIILLFLIFIFPISMYPTSTRLQKVGVYFGNWNSYTQTQHFQISGVPADKIDYLFYAFLNPSDGTCKFSDPQIDINFLGPFDGIFGSAPQKESDPIKGNMFQLKKLKERNPHLKVIASVGGYTFSKAFHDFIENDDKRKKLVSSCVDFLKQYRNIFDGLDIDLEYPCISTDIPCGDNITPTSDDRGNFAAMIQDFRRQMGPSPILSIATSADLIKIQALDFKKLDPVLDFYNIMTYDFTGGNFGATHTGHQTPLRTNPNDPDGYRQSLSAERAYNEFIKNGARANKINIGVAFYGRGFSIGKNDNKEPFQKNGGTPKDGIWEEGVIQYYDIDRNYGNKESCFFDEIAKASYVLDQEKGVFISYDDPKSIMAKTEFVREKGLMGVFAWQLTGDTEDFKLVEAMGK